MTTQQKHTFTDSAKTPKRDLILTVLGLALAAALVIGIGVRQTLDWGGTRTTAAPDGMETAADPAIAPKGAGSHPGWYPQSNPSRPEPARSYIYLVATQEEADSLRETFVAFRPTPNQAAPNVLVLVVGPSDDSPAATGLIGMLSVLQQIPGEPPAPVIDLRTRTATPFRECIIDGNPAVC